MILRIRSKYFSWSPSYQVIIQLSWFIQCLLFSHKPDICQDFAFFFLISTSWSSSCFRSFLNVSCHLFMLSINSSYFISSLHTSCPLFMLPVLSFCALFVHDVSCRLSFFLSFLPTSCPLCMHPVLSCSPDSSSYFLSSLYASWCPLFILPVLSSYFLSSLYASCPFFILPVLSSCFLSSLYVPSFLAFVQCV